MIAPVGCACGVCPQWTMIELQGELALNDPENSTLEGLDLGVLCLQKTGDIHITIGYHQLDGKVVQLKKPFVLLAKDHEGQAHKFKVAGIVKQKILFKTRPKALISKPT
mmetsp:Transcript_42634/g.101237  ORF Transcript_42634/g.101237 Transcript_42634/m.101237 type:complete len:109 (+) Transcript_42634:160-486(+)